MHALAESEKPVATHFTSAGHSLKYLSIWEIDRSQDKHLYVKEGMPLCSETDHEVSIL